MKGQDVGGTLVLGTRACKDERGGWVDVRVDREIRSMEGAEMGNSGMCFPCVDLFTSHSVHTVTDSSDCLHA